MKCEERSTAVGANEVQKVNKNDESQNIHAMKM